MKNEFAFHTLKRSFYPIAKCIPDCDDFTNCKHTLSECVLHVFTVSASKQLFRSPYVIHVAMSGDHEILHNC